MNIRVHIEELILDGVPLGRQQGPLVQAAVEAELGRLLAEGGLAPGLVSAGAIPRLEAGPLHVAPNAGPANLGTGIAGAVYAGIGR